VPELRERPYEHRKPHRPSHLARRTKPPPQRAEPPDLTLFIYAGLALAVIVMLLAIPYLLQYLATLLST
jgi:hypothetical protein